MKLYQTALKYHSDGPGSYAKASETYKALFESEIFHYPESQSELRRIDLYGPLPETDDILLDEQDDALFELPTASDNAPSTLPQILHLSHKNYGDFLLAQLQAGLSRKTNAEGDLTVKQTSLAASSALDHFVEALDKDDTDLDLWRRASALGELLGSQRIARFCLEALFDDDEEALISTMALPGLAESTAGQQLFEIVTALHDSLSLLQAPLSGLRRRHVSKMLKHRLELYGTIKSLSSPYYPKLRLQAVLDARVPQRSVLRAPSTWIEFGDLLLTQLEGDQHDENLHSSTLSGSALYFDLGSSDHAAENGERLAPVTLPSSNERMLVDAESTAVHTVNQFPGLDEGQPTVPLPSFGDLSALSLITSHLARSITLPSRKRSTDAAGILDTAESGRLKSKRIRARESLVDGGSIQSSVASRVVQQSEVELEQTLSLIHI